MHPYDPRLVHNACAPRSITQEAYASHLIVILSNAVHKEM